MAIMTRSMAAGRHGTGTVAEILHSYMHVGEIHIHKRKRDRKRETERDKERLAVAF